MKSAETKNYDVRDLGLAAQGKNKIEWAESQMPVLRAVRARFEKEKPLKGARIASCLHVTSETANLVRTLKAGGAEIWQVASNPLTTQDEVAAALVKEYAVPTWAIKGEDKDTYYNHLKIALAQKPNITLDDGADLVAMLHSERTDLLPGIVGGMEETTTGVIRLRAMAREGALKFPVIAVNDAATKHLFDNRYGTGQSTIDGILRACNLLFAGLNVVCAGYGWCGRG
ncbi:MAG: adenosylhomocysteinase, partial [Planctomycetes bacterium]|nr:adenosylhomocysteinase [Planctomycetota bacterium]